MAPLSQEAEKLWEDFKQCSEQLQAVRYQEDEGERFPREDAFKAAFRLAGGGEEVQKDLRQNFFREDQQVKAIRDAQDIGNARTLFEAAFALSSSSGASNPGQTAEPEQVLTMAEVDASCPIAQFPKQVHRFFVLRCVICDRTMESATSMFQHLNQAGDGHQALLGQDKSHASAVAACGIRVVDATVEAVEAHNAALRAAMDVS